MKFKTVYSEHVGLWYITDEQHRKVRIRTAGTDTGVNKSWVTQKTAQRMADRLNAGEKPPTVVIP